MTNSSLSSVLKSTVLVSLLALAGCGKDDGSASLKIGEEALESGDSEKAVRHLMTSLEVAPDNVDALVLLGEAQYNLGEPVNARKTALRALELAPNDVDVIELAAKTAFLSKDYEQAESLYQSLCTSDRDAKLRSRGLTGLGILDMARMPTAGENAHFYRDRARTRFLLAIRADAMSAAPRYHLALVYREWGYYGIARDNLAQFLHLDKLENKAGSDRAKRVSSRLLPELDDLISQDALQVKGADKRNASACATALAKAKAAWAKKAYKDARTAYEQAYLADVLCYEAAVGLAKSWETVDPSVKGLAEALKYYSAACKIRPSIRDVILKTAEIAVKLGRHATAVEAYSRAVAAAPKDITAIDGLIRALRRTGQAKSADVYQKYRDALGVRTK